jgi:hypothetical protein
MLFGGNMPDSISNPDSSQFYDINLDRFVTSFEKTRSAVVDYLSKNHPWQNNHPWILQTKSEMKLP